MPPSAQLPEARIALGAAMIRLSRTKVAAEDALFAAAAAGTQPATAFLPKRQ